MNAICLQLELQIILCITASVNCAVLIQFIVSFALELAHGYRIMESPTFIIITASRTCSEARGNREFEAHWFILVIGIEFYLAKVCVCVWGGGGGDPPSRNAK